MVKIVERARRFRRLVRVDRDIIDTAKEPYLIEE